MKNIMTTSTTGATGATGMIQWEKCRFIFLGTVGVGCSPFMVYGGIETWLNGKDLVNQRSAKMI